MQVLKEEVRERILDAAVQVFYEKDFRSAKLQDIARLADVSVSLLYSYFKNKEKLFESVVSSAPFDFNRIAREEEAIIANTPSERYQIAAEGPLLNMLAHHKLLVILIEQEPGHRLRACEGRTSSRAIDATHPIHGERACSFALPGLARPRARKQLRGEPNGGSPPLQQRE